MLIVLLECQLLFHDIAAIEFASTFYSSLGFGKSIKDAFDLALVQLELLSIPGNAIPKLIVKEGIDPSKMIINGKPTSDKESTTKPQPLCDQFESLKQNHQKLLMQQITINEFFKLSADSIFKFLSDSGNKRKSEKLIVML